MKQALFALKITPIPIPIPIINHIEPIKWIVPCLLMVLCVIPKLAWAGPMGFKDSSMSMGDFSANWREGFVNYALTRKDAIGSEAVYMRSDDKRLSREAVGFSYTRLAKRWNTPWAQANVWLLNGVSAVKGNNFEGTRTLLSPGVQFDYETTRVYMAAFARAYRAKDINYDYASLRCAWAVLSTKWPMMKYSRGLFWKPGECVACLKRQK
jgi:hypothetical protein